jgi:hypothetical protein
VDHRAVVDSAFLVAMGRARRCDRSLLCVVSFAAIPCASLRASRYHCAVLPFSWLGIKTLHGRSRAAHDRADRHTRDAPPCMKTDSRESAKGPPALGAAWQDLQSGRASPPGVRPISIAMRFPSPSCPASSSLSRHPTAGRQARRMQLLTMRRRAASATLLGAPVRTPVIRSPGINRQRAWSSPCETSTKLPGRRSHHV